MPVRGLPHDDVVSDLRAAELAWLGEGVDWFDAHTHIGHHDPDGFEADPEELVAALDVAGQERALLFAMQEPDGYRGANDWVLQSCAESGGRLVALGRIDPNAPDALAEAHRVLEAGARGFKLHPRSDAFALPHPVVEQVVALAGERRLPVLFHAGRGIPDLGESVVRLATEHPGARLILAHAGISDLGLLAPHVGALPNILFDTSWWHIADMLTLFSTVPPGQILYASDMPYGGPRFPSFLMLRCSRAVGFTPEQAAAIAGGQTARVVGGEDLLDLGPAAGDRHLGRRVLAYERVIGYLTAAVQMTFRGGDPTEALSLARLGCQAPEDHEHRAVLHEAERYIALAQQRLAEGLDPIALIYPAMIAMVLTGTAEALRQP
ncbi:MAG TPA: amidohydrolase family protein [Baekduia sp.]|nr:amidohydrolase family protein [Baekduia sp.]